MKNNTKIRLHLSKQLFESLTKQVLAEAKMSKEAMGGGAYTEMVKEKKSHTPKFDAYKQPKDQLPTEKKPKVTKAEKGSSEIKKANAERKIKEVDAVSYTNKAREIGEVSDRAETRKMEKMHEKMSSKEKMAKGLYKEEMEDESMMDEAKESLHKVMSDVESLSKEAKHKLHAALSKQLKDRD